MEGGCWADIPAVGRQGPGDVSVERRGGLWLGNTLLGKSKPKHWLFSFLPHQSFQGILAAEWLDEAGCDVSVVSSPPPLQGLHADLSSLPQASQPAECCRGFHRWIECVCLFIAVCPPPFGSRGRK